MLRELRGHRVAVAPWDAAGSPWSSCDAVLLRSVWDYHLRVDEFLGWVASLEAEGTRVWNPPALVTWNARKTYLRDLESSGVAIVPTLWLEPKELAGWPAAIESCGWSDIVLKPMVGASAYLTWRDSAGAAAARAGRLARLAAHGGALVQPFVREVESAGEWSLVFFEGEFSHAVRKRARAGEFRVQIEFGGSEQTATPPAGVLAAAVAALDAAPGESLYARVDGIETSGGFLLNELELIEPILFLDADEGAAARFANAIAARLDGRSGA